MPDYRTERESIRVTVKETAEGRPFLWFENAGGDPLLATAEFGLALKPETTLAEAEALARQMNARVTHLIGMFASAEVR